MEVDGAPYAQLSAGGVPRSTVAPSPKPALRRANHPSSFGDLTDGALAAIGELFSRKSMLHSRSMKGEATTLSKRAPRADIQRVDEEGFHGWVVTVWKNGIEHKRRIGEDKSRSPSVAFAAAVRFRDGIISGAGRAGTSKEETGIPGIRVGRVLTSAGRYVMNYTSYWYAARGTREVRIFSWLKHGKEEALRLAKRALREGRERTRRARRLRKKGKTANAHVEINSKSVQDRSMATRHPNVRRIDHHHFHGYVVTLWRVRSRVSKSFSDTTCGGRRAALERAVEYCDALLAELPPPVRIHRKSNTSTGIPGVSLIYDRARSGRVVPRFVARWNNADGREGRKSFSTIVHGFAGAESKAIQVRNEGVERLIRDRKAMLLEEIENRKRQRAKSGESRQSPPPSL